MAALQGVGRGTLDDVFLVSHDGSEPEVIELVNPKSGLKLAVANRPKELARQTLDTLGEVMAGKIPMDKDLDVPVAAEVLTPDNLDQLQKFLAIEYFGTTDLKQYATAPAAGSREGCRGGGHESEGEEDRVHLFDVGASVLPGALEAGAGVREGVGDRVSGARRQD